MPLVYAVAVGLAAVAAGHRAAGRLWPGASRGERLALAGALALAAAAYVVFLIGWAGQLRLGLIVGAALLLAGAIGNARGLWADLKGAAPPSWLWAGALTAFLLLAVIAALAPPVAVEWDALAYHLALPKQWLELNRVTPFPYDHHSYFPQLTEMLFTGGLAAAGYGGAKLMHTLLSLLTVLAAGGFAARRFGTRAGYWTALAVAACPLALWEAGTGYIDMSAALYTTLALLLLHDATDAEKAAPAAVGICAGLAASTKYTGLLAVILLAALMLLWARRARPLAWRPALVILVVGLAVASPWYIRTVVATGNPVYPFAYELFGGRYWSQHNADVYRGEQASFGVGHAPWDLPRAPWDLTTQPERYMNQGGLLGSIGLPLVLCPFLLAARRRQGATFWLVVGFSVLNLLAWFWLSQQSRYILALVPALAVLAGMAATAEGRPVLRACARATLVAQAVFIVVAFALLFTRDQVTVAFRTPGSAAVHEYLLRRLPQYRAAQAVNALPQGSKLALYDEVLGYYFDREYSWSNPGHHTLIPYDDLCTGYGLVNALRVQGVTHVLVDVGMLGDELRADWVPMLDRGAPTDGPLPPGTENWRRLLAQAVQSGLLQRETLDPGPGFRLYRIAAQSD
jgi:hypothetical protein